MRTRSAIFATTQRLRYVVLMAFISLTACQQVLEPKPAALLVDELVLNEPNDVQPVRIGLYSALRSTAAPNIVAGDFTADYIQFNGTFNDYLQLGSQQITAANGVAEGFWRTLYKTIYVANFILERLPLVSGYPVDGCYLRNIAIRISANKISPSPHKPGLGQYLLLRRFGHTTY